MVAMPSLGFVLPDIAADNRLDSLEGHVDPGGDVLGAVVGVVLDARDIRLYVADDVSDTLTGWFGQLLDPTCSARVIRRPRCIFPQLFAMYEARFANDGVFCCIQPVSESPALSSAPSRSRSLVNVSRSIFSPDSLRRL